MSLPQFTAGCSLREPTAQYYTATHETAPDGVQPQMTIGPGGGGGTSVGGIDWCPLIDGLCDLCVLFCDMFPFRNCYRICDWPCMACRF